MNLYTISVDINRILNAVDEDGCLSDEQLTALDTLEIDRVTLIDNVLARRQELVTAAAAIKLEIDRLKALYDQRDGNAERIKNYILNTMVSHGEKSLETPKFKVSVQNKPMSVLKLPDVRTLPAEFLRFLAPEADKTALLKAARAGEKLPDGVIVGSSGFSLRIR